MAMVVITEALIESGKSSRGGWTREQLHLLGSAWPPKKGWKALFIGGTVPDHVAERFVALKER